MPAAPQVLIEAQPTRGVDVSAIEFIHTRIVRARDEGAGVLPVSSELDDALTLSDRILVRLALPENEFPISPFPAC